MGKDKNRQIKKGIQMANKQMTHNFTTSNQIKSIYNFKIYQITKILKK